VLFYAEHLLATAGTAAELEASAVAVAVAAESTALFAAVTAVLNAAAVVVLHTTTVYQSKEQLLLPDALLLQFWLSTAAMTDAVATAGPSSSSSSTQSLASCHAAQACAQLLAAYGVQLAPLPTAAEAEADAVSLRTAAAAAAEEEEAAAAPASTPGQGGDSAPTSSSWANSGLTIQNEQAGLEPALKLLLGLLRDRTAAALDDQARCRWCSATHSDVFSPCLLTGLQESYLEPKPHSCVCSCLCGGLHLSAHAPICRCAVLVLTPSFLVASPPSPTAVCRSLLLHWLAVADLSFTQLLEQLPQDLQAWCFL
jgi:hypothetical protein